MCSCTFFDQRGRPSFQGLHHRTSPDLHLVFYIFDLLHLDGRDLTKRSLDERRAKLARIDLTPPLFLSEPLPGSVSDIEAAVRDLQLEGVVAKRRDSRYKAGKRSDAWVKVKFSARQNSLWVDSSQTVLTLTRCSLTTTAIGDCGSPEKSAPDSLHIFDA